MKNNLYRESIVEFKHLFRIMKLTALVLFLFAGMTFATPSYSQTMRVTIVGNGMRTGKVINEIEKQTEYLFVYDVDEVDMKRNVNVNAQNQPVAEVLDKVFDGTGVYYAMEGKNIMLMKKNAQQQDNKVTGVVKDANGDPIIGANVTVKGESIGTITDIDGRFILNAPSDAVLQITYIGYVAQDVKIDNRKEVVVTLVEDTETLDEVVVVGYGTQKKVNLTGSVGNVSLDDLGNRPITNASNALQGTVSGVYALQRSGQPGSDGSVINIRGVGTLNNSDPLVLIDGFPGSMSDVDASDISSISVLKDAASAAIYGNRAANGVVLITTKKGATGKVKLSYNGYFGIQEATSLPDVLNSYEYATLYNEACRNSGQAEKYLPEEIQKFREGTDPMYPSINYFDVYYDKATMQNHRLNVSGGSDTFQYAFMLGYLEQDGILVGTNYRKTDFRANIDSYLWNKRLRVTARLSGNYGVKKEPTDTWAAKWYATNAPVWPLKNTDGIWMSVNGERNYYGEIIVGACFTIPVYIASIISWARNLNKTDNIVKVNKNLSWQEWLCASLGDVMFTIGIFFLLDYFNTANLIISTLSVGSCAFARYLAVRRCEYNFLFQLPNNIMRMCLWIFVIIQKGDISYITTIIQYIMYLCLNIFGAFNWIRLKKIQRLRKMVLKKRTEKLVMDKDYMKEV